MPYGWCVENGGPVHSARETVNSILMALWEHDHRSSYALTLGSWRSRLTAFSRDLRVAILTDYELKERLELSFTTLSLNQGLPRIRHLRWNVKLDLAAMGFPLSTHWRPSSWSNCLPCHRHDAVHAWQSHHYRPCPQPPNRV